MNPGVKHPFSNRSKDYGMASLSLRSSFFQLWPNRNWDYLDNFYPDNR